MAHSEPFKLFLALAVIVAVCRLVGNVAERVGISRTVGEMIVGAMLRPSLFGAVSPSGYAAVFDAETKRAIYYLSQLGLALFMFLVGNEIDRASLRKKGADALNVSLAGLIAPFAIGSLLAIALRSDARLFPATNTMLGTVLFMGGAIAITPFPMLARILSENGLANTPFGALALGAAAFDDVLAWCGLAVVLSVERGEPATAIVTIAGAMLYALVVLRGFSRYVSPHVVRGYSGANAGYLSLGLPLVAICVAAAVGMYLNVGIVFTSFVLGFAFPRGVVA